MAIYVCRINSISRGQGRSTVSAAAYRSGERLYNEYTGETADYTRKSYVENKEILLPHQAPTEQHDRAQLQNAVEMAEKSKDGKLAIDIMVAIPIELNRAQRESMIHTFAESLVAKGMIIDYAIHNPPKRDDLGRPLDADGMPTSNPDKMQYPNPHCHIMIPIRPLGADGRFVGKSTTEYVCKNPDDGVVKRLTQLEIKESHIDQQKMFLCEVDGIKEYHTKPEIEKYGYKRIGRNALMTRHGRPSPEYAYRMSTQFVRDIRMLWEETANKALKDAGLDEKIDCRSYIDQNSQKIAEMHLGQSITTMQKKISRLQSEGKSISESLKYDIILLNKEIRKHNHMVDLYESRLASAGLEYNELEAYSRRLAVIKSAQISERCHRRELEQSIVKLTEDMESLEGKVNNYKKTMSSLDQKISSLISEKEDLEAILNHKKYSLKPFADSKIKKQLDKISDEIKSFRNRSIIVKEAYGYNDATMHKADELLLQRVVNQLDLAEKQLLVSKTKEKQLHDEYMNIRKRVPLKVRKRIQAMELRQVSTLLGDINDLTATVCIMLEKEIEKEMYTDSRTM